MSNIISDKELLIKEGNIYQKLAYLQDVIKVNKANRNDFADFSYRTIQDIFSELKPHLKDLGLIINFGGGKLDGDKYTLGIIVIDINKPDNRIDETGEIYIDRTKSKMDLSQKCLSAKTFLKKSLLEDLLLISEDDDPDSHDNTNKGKQPDKPKSNGNTPSNPKPATPNNHKKVTAAQLKRYFAIAKNQGADVKYMDELILKAFNLAKKEDWLMSDYNKFIEYFDGDKNKNVEGHSNEETISMLIKKDNANKIKYEAI